MNNILISIIIPCYKVEIYLSKCINSIIEQTYKNLEIFLVDDGSPDNSGKICDNYAKKDCRIKVIHKQNGGLSDARNVAIDVSTGEYIIFVDSDDFVAPDYVETLYRLIHDNDAQIGITSFKSFEEGIEPELDTHEGKQIKVMTSDEALENMFYQKDFDTSAWAKIYKRSLFDNIRYPKGWLYEDLATTYRLMMKCERVAFTNYMSYFYLIRCNSIEGSPFKPAKYDSCMKIMQQLKLVRESMSNEKVKKAIDCRIVSLLFHILLDIPKEREDMRTSILNEIISCRRTVLLDCQARKKARMACLLTFFGMYLIDFLASKGRSRNL